MAMRYFCIILITFRVYQMRGKRESFTLSIENVVDSCFLFPAGNYCSKSTIETPERVKYVQS